MMQQIEDSLLQEFEAEIQKAQTFQSKNLSLNASKFAKHRPFWENFLKQQLPLGSINKNLEKNFAIWISLNQIPIESIKECYSRNKWGFGPLQGWLKEVQEGKITTYNSGEVVQWCRQYNRPDLEALLPPEDVPMPQTELNVLDYDGLQSYTEKESRWIVKNLIKPKSIVIIAGKRSTLKSWFSMNMMFSIASKFPFLNRFIVEDNFPCVYLDRENGFAELRKRTSMVKSGLEIKKSLPNTYFISESPLKLDNALNLEAIEKLVIEKQIKVLFVDTYRRLISFEENDANDVSRFFVDMLKPFCERTGVSVVLIHHERKGKAEGDDLDMLRGSSDLANYVDGVIQVERKGHELIIKQTKSRGSKEIEPFKVKVETDETTYFKFVAAGEIQTAEQAYAKKITDWLILNKRTEVTYTELQGVAGKSSNTASAIQALVNTGILIKGIGHKMPYKVCKDLLLQEVLV